jgi:two-component sensor histidine kinase
MSDTGNNHIVPGNCDNNFAPARWSSASLAHIVQGATEPYDSKGEGRISIQGADLRIVSGAVIALAMTLNELCTNTTKFGALSVPGGHVEIAWTIDPNNERLHLTWIEKGGPAVQPPTRRSFGTRLIDTLGKQLNGTVEMTYDSKGFIHALDVTSP